MNNGPKPLEEERVISCTSDHLHLFLRGRMWAGWGYGLTVGGLGRHEA